MRVSFCWPRSIPTPSLNWRAQFGVRSIPAVFAVRDGKAVDGFVGVQPESVIRTWIDRLLPTPAETLAAQARHWSDPTRRRPKRNISAGGCALTPS